MAVKYRCPKCEMKFVEWGAKKHDFKCPHCSSTTLVKVGAGGIADKIPTLKRKAAFAEPKVRPHVADMDDIDDVEDTYDEDDEVTDLSLGEDGYTAEEEVTEDFSEVPADSTVSTDEDFDISDNIVSFTTTEDFPVSPSDDYDE